MTENAVLQITLYLLVVLCLVKPLGGYMACVYGNKPCGLDRILAPIERFIYRLCGIKPTQEMSWKTYLSAMLVFNLFGILLAYILQRFQFHLPLNPQKFPAISPDLSFNTAVSFVSNTSWQAYAGETAMSYLTQMLVITVQDFLSAATGMALLVAFIRGMAKHESTSLGNFWADVVRSVLYILLPLAFVFSLFLVSQGVIQNVKPYQQASVLQSAQHEQLIPMGPVASEVAIKQLGTDGGGFFNVNSAHPFENPTPLSNFFELLAILLIPAAFCYTFGVMINDRRQGWAILTAMLLLFVPFLMAAVHAEQNGNPAFTAMNIDQTPQPYLQSGGNMEGKETRFGIVNSALWAAATTASASGSVNSMHDSYMPLGGFIPLWLMHLSEVAFGGVGSGLYGMLMFVIITVFVAGLMVGRTPEYLGKKIEPYEMKMASIAILVMPLAVLIATAIAVVTPMGINAVANPGAHGFSEILYAFSSICNNNGSAFAGLNANTPFYNVMGGILMLLGRYWVAIPALAIAGSMVRKKTIPSSSGTLATYMPFFILLLVAVIIILSALSFLPALALGPVVEHLMMR